MSGVSSECLREFGPRVINAASWHAFGIGALRMLRVPLARSNDEVFKILPYGSTCTPTHQRYYALDDIPRLSDPKRVNIQQRLLGNELVLDEAANPVVRVREV